MLFPIAFLSFLFSAFALPHGSKRSNLPACDATWRKCSCPSGTFFQTSTSWIIYPAAVEDVTAATGNFFETAWFGTSPSQILGEPYTPGAKRILMGELPNAGVYPFTEELTMYQPLPNNQGYHMKFQMGDTPFYFNTTCGKQGHLAGTWDWVDVHSVGPQKTYMMWGIYACFSIVYGISSDSFPGFFANLRQTSKPSMRVG
ncbi:hypothetical protein EYZ11_007521 [Aspergillus tanneri]|uniref:Uncharacterized protein n=1 Tax=Aspergillus tanneri TaxID=1220188 RepID=A0A4S3JD65_9EURO|nr:hypothetical protein EYZ11_007521 [Aspergillus tanneri]